MFLFKLSGFDLELDFWGNLYWVRLPWRYDVMVQSGAQVLAADLGID